VYVGLGPVVSRARVLVHEVLAVRCRYLIVVPRSLPAVELDVRRSALLIYRGAQAVARDSSLRPAVARGAAQVVGRGAQAVARGGARCASRVLGRGA